MTLTTLFSISEIEQETGISRDTLRAWERRYNFPTPTRNQRSERMYTLEQLRRLRLIKQLLDDGMRPGKLVTLDTQQLRQLTGTVDEEADCPADIASLLESMRSGPRHSLMAQLRSLLQRYGLRDFLTEVATPMNRAVGEAWFRGEIGIFDEHLYSEQMRRVLTDALNSLPPGREHVRVLLTTLPGELHSLGLLMAACMLSLEGAQVLLIGVQTPLDEIVRGVRESDCNVVGLSCSEHLGRRTIAAQLVKLSKLLPKNVMIWAGGNGVRSLTMLQDRIQLFTDLKQIPAAFQTLRDRISA